MISTEQAKRENLLMENAMRIQELFDDMCYTNQLNPDKIDMMDDMERFQIFCKIAREFEDDYHDTEAYNDDWISLTDEIFTNTLKNMF